MRALLLTCVFLAASSSSPTVGPPQHPAAAVDRNAQLNRVLDDYIRLYARDTLHLE